jgi:sulfatase modifying factor 1
VYGGPTAAIVGSKSPTGDGKWGQADLSGNVREWVQDIYVNPYPAGGCDNCTITSGSTERSIRGGSYYDNTVGADLLASHRDADSQRNVDTGARCARSAN